MQYVPDPYRALFLKYILSICILVMLKIPLMIHQILINTNHHHLDLCWIFFNVNNKTILYPCTERTDGALVRRVSHYIFLDFAAVVYSLSSYCWTAVNQSWKRLWHGTWLQGFWKKTVFLSTCCLSRQHQSQIPFISTILTAGWILNHCKIIRNTKSTKWVRKTNG